MGTPTNTIIIHTQSREARHLLDQHARLWKKLLPCSDDSGKHRDKRLIDIVQPGPKTIDALNKLSLPAGVDIKIKASG